MGDVRLRGVRGNGGVWISLDGESRFVPDEQSAASGRAASATGADPLSPMPGRVTKVFVKAGEAVKAGQPLAAVEAMKMEYLLKAPADGTVGRVLCNAGDTVALGQRLMDWKAGT